MKLKLKAVLASIFFIPAVVHADDWPQKFIDSIDVKEAAFCAVLKSYSKQIKDAQASKNQIRVRRVHKKQLTDIEALMPTGVFQDWIIMVQSIKVDGSMNATLEATLPCHKTIIGQKIPETNETAYEQLADVGKGEYVLVSGKLNFDPYNKTPQKFSAVFSSIVGLN